MGEVTHRCIVKGLDLYCMYKGLELITKAMGTLVGEGVGVVILLSRIPLSLFRPVVQDTKTKSLLLAMSELERKGKYYKVILSNDKKWLDKYLPLNMEGGMDWDNVRVHTALHGKPALKQAVQAWGSRKWGSRWSDLNTCGQTKIWFPFLREDRTPLIGRLSRTDLGLLIQFVTGHNYLRRHRRVLGEKEDKCRLCGEDIEDSLHLWENCKGTRDLRGGGFIKCKPTIWSLSQLSMFLREQPIAGLMDRNGEIIPGSYTNG